MSLVWRFDCTTIVNEIQYLTTSPVPMVHMYYGKGRQYSVHTLLCASIAAKIIINSISISIVMNFDELAIEAELTAQYRSLVQTSF